MILSPLARPAVLLLGVCAFLGACSTESTNLVDPPKVYDTAATEGGNPVIEINPKVDILFVIDDSMSMINHQRKLVDNIQYFVDEFAKFKVIDFHIGLVTTWDSVRYRTKTNPDGVVPQKSSDGFVNFYPNGQLQPLKAPEGKQSLLKALRGKNYVSRTSGFTELLRATLSLPPKCHESYSSCQTPIDPVTGQKEGRGPEYEEFFSPVIEALSNPTLLKGPNKGFKRKGSHLVVIFITDADDITASYSASQMRDFLERTSNSTNLEKNYSVYGVLHPTNYVSSTCKKDPINKAQKLEELINLTNGTVINICEENYGKMLSSIGEKIRRTAMAKTIFLPYRPEYLVRTEQYNETTAEGKKVTHTREVVDWIQVRYGKKQIIPSDPVKGWTYDGRNNAVIIHEGLEITPEAGAGITVEYIPVKMENRNSGRVQNYLTNYQAQKSQAAPNSSSSEGSQK